MPWLKAHDRDNDFFMVPGSQERKREEGSGVYNAFSSAIPLT